MKCGPAQGKTRRRPRRRSDGGIEAVPTLQGGLGRRMVGEHLNEAPISRLGSILECGNMTFHPDCRVAVRHNISRVGSTRPWAEPMVSNS